jgi:hypothetical protein
LTMDRLLRMDRDGFIEQMRPEMDRIMGQIADAVNDAPDGKVIRGSEMRVRDLMAQARQRAFEKAVQMRIDSTESSFFPSEGCQGQAEAEQGSQQPQHAERQRPDRVEPQALVRGRGGQ